LSEETLTGEDKAEAIRVAYNKLLDYNKPKNFIQGHKENILTVMDKAHTKTLFALSENNLENPGKFSMFEFRTAIEMLKERNDRMKEDIDKMKQK